MRLRSAATAITLVNGVWAIAAGAYWSRIFTFVPNVSGPLSSENVILLALGVILLLDSIACYMGWTEALYASAALSLLIVLDIAIGGVQFASPMFAGSLLLGLLAIAVDILAARRKLFIPEEDHPLNLPVFG